MKGYSPGITSTPACGRSVSLRKRRAKAATGWVLHCAVPKAWPVGPGQGVTWGSDGKVLRTVMNGGLIVDE